MMKKIFGIAILVVACVGAFFVARPWFDKPLFKSDAEATAERLVAQAEAEKAPDQPFSEVLRNVANEESERVLANAGSVEKRRLNASYQFSAFYYINTLFRKNYCQKLGVDISPFVSAFKKENAGSYNEARKVWLKEGINAEAMVRGKAVTFESLIGRTMKDTAKVNGLSVQQTCQMFVNYADELAQPLSLEVLMPQVYAALREK